MTATELAPAGAGASYGPRGYRYRWMVMAVVIIADVMDLLDATVANLAGPSIRADLGGSASTLQWVLAAYTMAFAIGLVTSARLGDLVGRRRMFIIGMVGFTVASLLCGLAPTAWLLIAFRVLQGLFGAVMIPQGLAMVKQSFAPEDLQKAFIPFARSWGSRRCSARSWPGFLLHADLFGTGWRMIFLINVPVGLVGAALAWRYLPDVPRDLSARLDPRGVLLLTAASALLIYPLVQGREHDWALWTWLMMAASAVVFAPLRVERAAQQPPGDRAVAVPQPRVRRRPGLPRHVLRGDERRDADREPLPPARARLHPDAHRHRDDAAGAGDRGRGRGLGRGPGRRLGAALGPKFGRRVLHGGLVLTTAGLAWLAFTLGGGTPVDGWDLAPPLFLAGLGSGLIFAPLFDIILADLGDHEVGTGSGLLNAVQQFCGALGVAILGTLFFQWLPADGWYDATQEIVWVSIGFYAVAFVAAFLLPKRAREDAAVH